MRLSQVFGNLPARPRSDGFAACVAARWDNLQLMEVTRQRAPISANV
jgi:hypothetical protein